MKERLVKKYLRRQSVTSKDKGNYPAVSIDGHPVPKDYGLHEDSDVTRTYYTGKDDKRVSITADVSIYDIKDYSSVLRNQSEGGRSRDNITDKKNQRRGSLVLGNTLHRSSKKNQGSLLEQSQGHRSKNKQRKNSLVPGNTIHGSTKKNPKSLLEQSQSYRSLQNQITNRLFESNPTDRRTREISKKHSISPLDNDRLNKPNPSATVFLKSQGIHVHVTESPKEALSKKLPKKAPGRTCLSNNNSNKLLITGAFPKCTPEEETRRSEISSYAIRRQYGQHLEKNWFRSFLRTRDCKSKTGMHQSENAFTPDMFYSPEPDSDDDTNDRMGDTNTYSDDEVSNNLHDVKVILDDTSRYNGCGDYDLKMESAKFASMDVLVSDGDSDQEDDIELVLKNGHLIERRVKNKMYRKRERQLLRFQQYLDNSDEISEDSGDLDVENMSDKELRAMRLKLKKPRWKPKLTGIARFRQAVKSVLVLLYFNKMLKDSRRMRRSRSKRNKRIRSFGALESDDDEYSWYRKYKNLKERFLDEVGWKLVNDVANLGINDGFGYDIRDELASGERRSRYKRLLDIWFPEDEETCAESFSIPDFTNPAAFLKRSSSCPELIKPKEFRVLFVNSRKVSIKNQGSKKKKSKISQKSKSKTKTVRTVPEKGVETEAQVIGITKSERRNSLTLADAKKSKRINLRDLLKDVHIPAKEIRIQIAERKMRKQKNRTGRKNRNIYEKPRDGKSIIDAERFKLPEFHFEISEIKTSVVAEEKSVSPDPNEHQDPVPDTADAISIVNNPFVGTGVSWNRPKYRAKETWTNEELDKKIARSGELFLEMRHCRYIRWNRLTQAMIDRMIQLENESL